MIVFTNCTIIYYPTLFAVSYRNSLQSVHSSVFSDIDINPERSCVPCFFHSATCFTLSTARIIIISFRKIISLLSFLCIATNFTEFNLNIKYKIPFKEWKMVVGRRVFWSSFCIKETSIAKELMLITNLCCWEGTCKTVSPLSSIYEQIFHFINYVAKCAWFATSLTNEEISSGPSMETSQSRKNLSLHYCELLKQK